MNRNIVRLVYRLYLSIDKKIRPKFLILLALTVVTSIAEVVSIGAIIPFIGVLVQPEKLYQNNNLVELFDKFNIASSSDLLVPMMIMFAVASFFAAIMRLLLLWYGIRVSNIASLYMGVKVYKNTLFQPYNIHVQRNSSEIISAIMLKVATASSAISSVVVFLTSTVLLFAILSVLLLANPEIAIISIMFFGLCYMFISFVVKKTLKHNSQSISRSKDEVLKSLQEGLASIRDIILDRVHHVYSTIYYNSSKRLINATGENQFITLAPRYVMEFVGVFLIITIAYMETSDSGELNNILPLLGVMALSAQKTLPLLQQLYTTWSYISGSRSEISEVINFLEDDQNEQRELENNLITFNEKIELKNISYQYIGGESLVIKDIDLVIDKGSKVGIIGSTGSGKSTILDIIMTLLEPTSGGIYIDGVLINKKNQDSWRKYISHVPQNVILIDASISENIAFGIEKNRIDMNRVREVAVQAKIDGFIDSKAKGYDLIIGESGALLSGGQLQRIGIARALYKQSEVLILDEATSALDSKTEEEIVNEIEKNQQDVTIIMISHRMSTLKNCDVIIELDKRGIRRVTDYNKLK
jgi:ATP-binding cassette, subfamily B, bacterial PglK